MSTHNEKVDMLLVYGESQRTLEEQFSYAPRDTPNVILKTIPGTRFGKSVVRLNLKYSYQENGYHDYKLHNLEHLSDPHQQRRINYVAQVMVNLEINDNRFFHHVLWTDESRFVSNGKPNRKNEHFWATENPHFVNTIDNQGHFGINVWCVSDIDNFFKNNFLCFSKMSHDSCEQTCVSCMTELHRIKQELSNNI
ncbi:hypothetical protein NQ318_009027 [Aromia moschata]|uniref:Uncharacterized protein n=1 Tax=Aromia moschata TaxID=1265417 RepID=A0AAV8YUI4_9CUCU|nr:hypothetical protein NQ318_009027 [Aromia moschata]